jgi:L-ascorbate metabolism protein UlaG (beta-lactamase superfamily)
VRFRDQGVYALHVSARPRITLVGHATVLIELGRVRLLTDPVLRSRLGHLRRHGAAADPAVGERLDAVLLSHLHLDHLDLPSLRSLDPEIRLLVPRGAGGFLRQAGFANADELVAGDVVDVNGVAVAATRAVHAGQRRPLGPVADAIGFAVRGERSVYFAGDTDLFPEMAELAPGLDLALLPVWGWGPTLGGGHLDPEAAARAAALLRPRIAVPIHWGTLYPRGLARWKPGPLRDPPRRFAAQVAEVAPGVEVRVLDPGESLEL